MTMYKNRFRSNLSQNQDNKDMSFEEEQELSKNYLDIWDLKIKILNLLNVIFK